MASLSDFEPLTPAEEKLKAAVAIGKPCIIAAERPDEDGKIEENTVRAEFLRFLALGGGDKAPVHEKGVFLQGAWIEGELDFHGCDVPRSLVLFDCWFDTVPVFADASMKTLALSDSRVPGMFADGLKTTGSVFLRKDGETAFRADGEVRLRGAKLGGNLECNDGSFENPDGNALSADGLETTGSVFLSDGFTAKGVVRLLGAKLGGDLVCSSGSFENPDGLALFADRLETKGGVFLCDGFMAKGEVRLLGAKIGGNLDCFGGSFESPDGTALKLQKAQISGGWVFRDIQAFKGGLNLTAAHVADLVDAADAWPETGELILDGFTYDRISGYAPTDFAARRKWLERQFPSDLNEDFRPQPFEQLAKVLREMGHSEDAKNIAILKQDYQRKAEWLWANWGSFGAVDRLLNDDEDWQKKLRVEQFRRPVWRLIGPGLRWLFTGLFKLTAGYGYRPTRALVFMAVFLVVGTLVFSAANNEGAMVPNNPFILRSVEWTDCIDDDMGKGTTRACWLAKNAGKDFTRFQPFVYSLDTFIPIVDLHQETNWIPQPERGTTWIGRWARFYLWVHIAFGWILTTVAVAGFTGLIKKDV